MKCPECGVVQNVESLQLYLSDDLPKPQTISELHYMVKLRCGFKKVFDRPTILSWGE